MPPFILAIAAVFTIAGASVGAQALVPGGELKGTAWAHSEESLAASVQQADVCLPSAATGGTLFCGKFKDIPRFNGRQVPVIVFLHGSSGLGLKAIGEWQQWLAGLGYASIAPDSFALAGHVTYKSPIDKESYERILTLRASEIAPTLAALRSQAWADLGSNDWLGNPEAQGHCGAALKDNARASVLLVPNAPHTLLNLPATRSATAGFLYLLARP